MFLELEGASPRRFVVDVTKEPVFSCGGFSLEIVLADGSAATIKRIGGDVSDLGKKCIGEIEGEFLLPFSNGSSVIQRMKELNELFEAGLINEEEFSQKREENRIDLGTLAWTLILKCVRRCVL